MVNALSDLFVALSGELAGAVILLALASVIVLGLSVLVFAFAVKCIDAVASWLATFALSLAVKWWRKR